MRSDDDADTEHDRSEAATVYAKPGEPPSHVPTLGAAPVQGRAPEGGLGRYDLGEVLGRGGMGEVVSARDEHIGRAVAIKRMRGEQTSGPAVARFLREARIQGQLEHPAIVPVHELSRDAEGHPYFVMKQLHGITLADVLRALAGGDAKALELFPRQRLLRVFCEICLAVELAHSRKIVHRDLKPANIMLGDFGEVYVLDWGIARVIGSPDEPGDDEPRVDVSTDERDQTAAGTTLGTPGYMSFEQLRGDPTLDGRADVYALGCILFEILTLQPLVPRGGTPVTYERVPSKRAPEREIPPELDAICVAATHAEREDRYATARELGDAVQRFLDGDRDLALRKQLGADELAAARTALARDDRPGAIRAAARALALDPSSRAAAELVARLMLEPPGRIPPEVERALEAVDLDALYRSRTLVLGAAAVFLAFVPLLAWLGLRAPWFIGTAVALAGVMATGGFAAKRDLVLASRISMLGIAGAIALVAWVLTPFLVAPGLAAVAGMTIASHPRVARAPVLALLFAAAVFGPWLLQATGVTAETISISGDAIVFHVGATLDPTATVLTLVIYSAMLIVLAITFGASLTNARRAAQRTTQVQTWQLSQLVPRATP